MPQQTSRSESGPNRWTTLRRLGIAAAVFGIAAFAVPQYGVWVRTVQRGPAIASVTRSELIGLTSVELR